MVRNACAGAVYVSSLKSSVQSHVASYQVSNWSKSIGFFSDWSYTKCVDHGVLRRGWRCNFRARPKGRIACGPYDRYCNVHGLRIPVGGIPNDLGGVWGVRDASCGGE